MSTTKTSIQSVLNSLITTLRDGEEGFRSAADNVKAANLKALFSELASQRQKFTTQLQTLLLGMGREPDDSGSVVGALHRGWIDLKGALTSGNDHAILAECERGEDSAVAEYRDALSYEQIPQEIRTELQRQYAAVKTSHDRIRDLRDESAS